MKIVTILFNDFAHWDTVFPDAEKLVARKQEDIDKIAAGDIVILHGGTDINPAIYGHERHPYTQTSDTRRDAFECEAVAHSIRVGANLFGICRGAQLLCAMNGGTLKQHITGHHTNHKLIDSNGRSFWSNSCHHQMMQPAGNYKLLAHTILPLDKHNQLEPEIVYWPDTKSYAVQGHPEWLEFESDMVQHVINEAKELWDVRP